MKILVVEDEPEMKELITQFLQDEGYVVETADTFNSGMDKIADYDYDCILLDIMLPGGSGLEILRHLKSMNKADSVIIISAKDSLDDKVMGLDLGADDYLTKPFNPRELVARVKAVLRRSSTLSDLTNEEQIQFGDILIDPRRREVRIGGQPVKIRTQEFDLLYTLARQPGIVLSRDQLLDQAWGYDYYGNTRTVDVHIGHLRKKLSGSNVKIETVTKVGYKLVQ